MMPTPYRTNPKVVYNNENDQLEIESGFPVGKNRVMVPPSTVSEIVSGPFFNYYPFGLVAPNVLGIKECLKVLKYTYRLACIYKINDAILLYFIVHIGPVSTVSPSAVYVAVAVCGLVDGHVQHLRTESTNGRAGGGGIIGALLFKCQKA